MPSAETEPWTGTGTLALAIPAFDEDGIDGFLRELDKHLADAAARVEYYVVDDASSSDMPARLDALGSELGDRLHVVRNPTNRGHGPTVLRAYELALGSGADVVFQVDGDGQFDGADARRLLAALDAGADVAFGTRRSRVDPWFRRALSRALQVFLRIVYSVTSSDPNCPFRAFRPATLSALLATIPADAMIPNVYLTILAGRRPGLTVVEVPVRHRSRRGASAAGTTWGTTRHPLLVPRRLVLFAARALVEAVRLTPTLRSPNRAS